MTWRSGVKGIPRCCSSSCPHNRAPPGKLCTLYPWKLAGYARGPRNIQVVPIVDHVRWPLPYMCSNTKCRGGGDGDTAWAAHCLGGNLHPAAFSTLPQPTVSMLLEFFKRPGVITPLAKRLLRYGGAVHDSGCGRVVHQSCRPLTPSLGKRAAG